MAFVELDLMSAVSVPSDLPRVDGAHTRPDLHAIPRTDLTPAVAPHYRGLLSPATRAGRLFMRLLEILPGAITWSLVTAPLWAGLLLPAPLAVGILAFDMFWLYLSTSTAVRAMVGYRRLRTAEATDWREEHRRAGRSADLRRLE
ncbi:MAG: hypothetical protein U0531_06005 [Dehalococcoidia bacterium]